MTRFKSSLLKKIGTNVLFSEDIEIRRPESVLVGNNVAIDKGFYVTTSLEIADYVHIGPYVSIIGGSEAHCVIEDFVGISAGTRIICLGDEHLGAGLVGPLIPRKFRDNLVGGETIIKRFAGLGTNCVILPGVQIAEGSVVAAGCIVSKDTKPWTVYAGNPCKAVRERPFVKMKEYASSLGYRYDD